MKYGVRCFLAIGSRDQTGFYRAGLYLLSLLVSPCFAFEAGSALVDWPQTNSPSASDPRHSLLSMSMSSEFAVCSQCEILLGGNGNILLSGRLCCVNVIAM